MAFQCIFIFKVVFPMGIYYTAIILSVHPKSYLFTAVKKKNDMRNKNSSFHAQPSAAAFI